MTSRDRFLAAVRNQAPDRVPVTPDISNYIPCKRTGLPFWAIYFQQQVPLWKAYLDAAAYFGIDAWVASCGPRILLFDDSRRELLVEDNYRADRDAMIRRTRLRTPDGDLTACSLCFRADPPSPVEKFIKDITRDFRAFRWMMLPPTGIDINTVERVRTECERLEQPFGLSVGYPGFHAWSSYVEGGVEPLAYALHDCPEILDEWFELDLEYHTRSMDLILAAKPDYVLLGGSGTVTLATPELVERYALPAIQRLSRQAKEAGVPTMLHSCGKSRDLVRMLAERTDVNLINPLETPPMGDIDLGETKRRYGSRIALRGNLHTTDVMLRGSPGQVRQAALEAIRDAGAGGGFILSTGDQCGRETPDENLFAMIETAREFGGYDTQAGVLSAFPH